MFASFIRKSTGSIASTNNCPAIIEQKFLLYSRFNRSASAVSLLSPTRTATIANRSSMLSTAADKSRQVLPLRQKCRNFSSPSEKPPNGASQTAGRKTGESSPNSAGTAKEETGFKEWLQWFLGPKPMPERYTFAWYREMTLICTVFAITGSSTLAVSKSAALTPVALSRQMNATVEEQAE